MADRGQFADGVPASATAELVAIYARAGQRLADVVVKPFGGTANARRFNRGRAAELLSQVDAVLRETKGLTVAWAGQNVARAYRLGQATAVSQLRSAGLKPEQIPVAGGFSLVDRSTVATIAADIAISLDAGLTEQARNAQRFLRAASQTLVADSEISRVVAQGAIDGDLVGTYKAMRNLITQGAVAKGEIAAELAESYRSAGRQIIRVGKAEMTVKSYAEMLVLTRTREASVHARHERLVANGRDLVSIIGRITEYFCTGYVGRVYSITGRDGRYPALRELPGGGPPFHPRCSKSTRAYIEELAGDQQRQFAQTRNAELLTTSARQAQAAFDAGNEFRLAAARQRRLHEAVAG